MLEKLSSHRYVVEKGSNVEIALFARMGNSLAAVTQNCPNLDQQSSALNHDLVSVQLFPPAPAKSCPVPRAAAELYGSLTQSRQSVANKENKMTTSALEFSNVVQQC